jgi:uncharacterized MAPEG superfamily protein
MTLAEDCLFATVLLYLLTLAPVKATGHREFKNSDPRSTKFYELPIRARALGAHQNGIETFPFFMGAILLAEFRTAPQGWIDALALTFVALRVAYVLAYVGDRPTMRTLLWSLGFAMNVAIFFLPAVRH